MLSTNKTDVQLVANKIKRDVESFLGRTFNTWDLIDYECILTETDRPTYRMKIMTDDNGYVKVRTIRKEPGHDWETHVEEYNKGYAIDEKKSPLPGVSSAFKTISQEMRDLAQSLKEEIEGSLGRTFNTWNLVEYEPIMTDPGRSIYRMKMMTDDNGHVKVKTVMKDPGHDWEIHVEEYDKGRAIERGSQNKDLDQEKSLSSTGSAMKSISQEMRDFARTFKKDIEKSLGRTFKTWNLVDYEAIAIDPARTTYRMKMITDDNGHVKVKTVMKNPGHEWETHIEEYDRGQALERGSEKQRQNKALDERSTGTSQGNTALSQGNMGASENYTSTSQG